MQVLIGTDFDGVWSKLKSESFDVDANSYWSSDQNQIEKFTLIHS